MNHLNDIAQRLLQISDYAARHKSILNALIATDDLEKQWTIKDYEQDLACIPLDKPFHEFSSALRQFRHHHLLRLLLRELAHLATTTDTMTAWSDFADVVVLRTLEYCEMQLIARHGSPCHVSGERAQLYVLAMGKLGGRELNFSSDIDLIFAFSEAGFTDGAEPISHQQYYTKMIQQFIQLLQNVTAEGFVFRVDLRLRPNGESGPLVSSLMAMETYYQEQGRDWERYAMVKARLIGHDSRDKQHWFQRLITPFVYRRYVDFSVIESLRSMKAMIEREVQLNPLLDDIKRGQGGIREVEFIIQSFQLIRGGRLTQIRQQNAMAAFDALKQQGVLAHTSALQHAYIFLRKLENALQAQNDRQTHTLPDEVNKQTQIGIAMGYANWADLLTKLHQYQRIISLAFGAVLNKIDGYEDENRQLLNQLSGVWQGHVETTMAINLLASLGFGEAARCYQLMHSFRHGPRCRRLSQAARMRLDRFMVLLLQALTNVKFTDVVLLQVLRLLESIVGRSAYLALLTENPSVLQELLHWFEHSPFITGLFVTQPFLLEVLIDQKQSWKPPSRRQLAIELQEKLTHCQDSESHGDVLRQFKLTCWLLAARAEMYGQCNAVRMGRFLADVAEVIITNVLAHACEQLAVRYPEMNSIKSKFAIIAYGKVGSYELNYDSDLDLVFLHQAKASDESLVTRLTQKIIHMLTTRSQAGVLYAVDTRLRPSGAAGLLVSHMDAFIDYQQKSAWTWEHQALVRSRVLFGNPRMKQRFYQLKHDVLCVSRDKFILYDDIQKMRIKIDKHTDSDSIKYCPGGLLDLEFWVQFLILAYPNDGLIRKTNTWAQLKQLAKQGVINAYQLNLLKKAYQFEHYLLHRQLLQPDASLSQKQQENVMMYRHFIINNAKYTPVLDANLSLCIILCHTLCYNLTQVDNKND